VILPLGISFITFQKIAFLIDVHAGRVTSFTFRDYALFVLFFPQLVAGPIVHYREMMPQFHAAPCRFDAENAAVGISLFFFGLAKKLVLADPLSRMIAPIYLQAAHHTPVTLIDAWIAALGFTLQIYFDFSGYSDMAIGLALMFGLRLPFNFDAPYRAVSVRDFWRRWHMTLSRFLRDYLYIPLGGNRSGVARQVVNVVLTMLLGGLWHGANWTFVVWGGLHGAGLAVNHLWSFTGLRLPRVFAWALTMLFVILAWVLFRAASFSIAYDVLRSMAGLHGLAAPSLQPEFIAAIIAGCLVATIGPASQRFALTLLRPAPWLAVPAGILLSWLLLLIGGRLPNVFIYFQF
jgi:D-alanyl-lipoteichoic acid acyltransferase DltB (MBOAT superfamily)